MAMEPLRNYHLSSFDGVLTVKLSEEAIKTFLPVHTLYTLTQRTHHNRLKTEAGMRIQMSSIGPDIKQIHKTMKHCHSPYIFFCFVKYSHLSLKKNLKMGLLCLISQQIHIFKFISFNF